MRVTRRWWGILAAAVVGVALAGPGVALGQDASGGAGSGDGDERAPAASRPLPYEGGAPGTVLPPHRAHPPGYYLAAPLRLTFDAIGAVASGTLWLYDEIRELGSGDVPLVEPTVGSVGPRSGPAGGLRLSPGPFFLEGAYSIRESYAVRAGVETGDPGTPRRAETPTWVRAAGAWERHAQPHFWGIGIDAPEASRSDFRWDRREVAVEARWLPGWRPLEVHDLAALTPRGTATFGLTAGAGLEHNRVRRGLDDRRPDLHDAFDPEVLFGAGERTRFARLSAGAEVDLTARESFYPTGMWLGAGSDLYLGVDGTPADFHRLRGEARLYLPVNGYQGFAFRGLLEANRGDAGPGVPFTHLASLGSERGLRGYSSDRFRDRDMAALSSEWRYEVWRDEPAGVQGFVFFDVGSVAPRLDDLDRFRNSYGIGLRLFRSGQAQGVAYLAHSDDGFRVDLGFGHGF